MSISQNGWPALAADSAQLVTWIIPGGDGPDTRIRLRYGCAGFLLAHNALAFDRRVERLWEPQLDEWGYAYRAVRGFADDLSNHASGTATDLNATEHPLGAVDTFTPAEDMEIRKRLRVYAGCIRWGGDYSGRKDEMHFELDKSLSVCNAVAISLMNTHRGRAILAANPAQRRIILA